MAKKYIDAEPIIVALRIMAKEHKEKAHGDPFEAAYAGTIAGVADTIDMLPAVDIPRWIPVTERLPEKYGQYLVTFIPSGGTLWTKVLIARYSDLMGIAKPSFHIGEVGKNSFVNINEQVIAWMPLPEPYKGGAEE